MTFSVGIPVIVVFYLLTAIGVGSVAWLAVRDKHWMAYIAFGLAWVVMLPFCGFVFAVIAFWSFAGDMGRACAEREAER